MNLMTKMPPIIILSAPPLAGKDTSARFLLSCARSGEYIKPSAPFKKLVHNHYGLYGITPNHYEGMKDTPRPEFKGLSARQAYIDYFERYLKRRFGRDIIVKPTVQRLKDMILSAEKPDLVVIDGSTMEEFGFLKESGASASMKILRIHRASRTFEAAKDSREFLRDTGLEEFDVYNEGTTSLNEQMQDFAFRLGFVGMPEEEPLMAMGM